MSSLNHENLRRAEHEIRNSVGHSNEGSGAMWFLAVVVIAALVGGMYVYSAGDAPIPVDAAPAATEPVAPVAIPTE